MDLCYFPVFTIDFQVPAAMERLSLWAQPSEKLSLFAAAWAEHASWLMPCLCVCGKGPFLTQKHHQHHTGHRSHGPCQPQARTLMGLVLVLAQLPKPTAKSAAGRCEVQSEILVEVAKKINKRLFLHQGLRSFT